VDIAVACFVSSDVVVMLGDGNGGFAAPQLYSLLPGGASPYWILSGDLDNDGVAELIASNNGSFSVLDGNGDGTFDPPVARTAQPGFFLGADAADYDGDGWLDLAFANTGQDEVWVYRNTTGACVGECCIPQVELDASGTLHWNTVPGAIGYDIIRGDLQLLQGGGGGGFTVATEECLAGLHPATSFTITGSPAAGESFWFLVRGVTAAGAGSYDSNGGGLIGGRDAAIAASGFDCGVRP